MFMNLEDVQKQNSFKILQFHVCLGLEELADG